MCAIKRNRISIKKRCYSCLRTEPHWKLSLNLCVLALVWELNVIFLTGCCEGTSYCIHGCFFLPLKSETYKENQCRCWISNEKERLKWHFNTVWNHCLSPAAGMFRRRRNKEAGEARHFCSLEEHIREINEKWKEREEHVKNAQAEPVPKICWRCCGTEEELTAAWFEFSTPLITNSACFSTSSFFHLSSLCIPVGGLKHKGW